MPAATVPRSQAFTPRIPLTLAETFVDFEAHNREIEERRAAAEWLAQPKAKRLAFLAVEFRGLVPHSIADELGNVLERSLLRTLNFGYQQARREIRAMRAHEPVRAYAIPDAGRYAQIAQGGVESIRLLVRRRAREAAQAVMMAVATAELDHEAPRAMQVAGLAAVAVRTLHNHVLELVGETLNLGRTAGALSVNPPPEFALRSEQLDKNTCDACTRLHGEIVEVGSEDYFRMLPPADCFGGGRCRGIYVFGGEPAVRPPVAEAA